MERRAEPITGSLWATVHPRQATTSLVPDTFSTRCFPERDQAEAWRERFRPVLDVTPADASCQSFPADNEVWHLGALTVSRVWAPAACVVRTKASIRRSPVDHWVLTYCRHGATVVKTRRGSFEAAAGVPFLWSLGEQSESRRTEVDRIQFFLARDSFSELAPVLDAVCGSVLDTPLGLLLGDYMLALERKLPTFTAAEMPALEKALGSLVSASVRPSAERVADARIEFDVGRMEQVRRAVRKHLRSPTLGPVKLCRLVGMSRSNLYRMFKDAGGIAKYIQRQRLLEAEATLCDAAGTASIASVANDLCFADASTFSRAFRREFGYTPSDARAAALAGLSLSPRASPGAFLREGRSASWKMRRPA